MYMYIHRFSLIMMAALGLAIRQAEESGRRQAEERLRSREDQLYNQVRAAGC
jgi:hypothetical protein